MQGMLTEQKWSRTGTRLRRRTRVPVGEKELLIRRVRPGKETLPRVLRHCDALLYPAGDPKNRVYSQNLFRFFLPRILSKLERVYFPDKSVCVALVSDTLTPEARTALIQTLFFAGNCLICTRDTDGERLTAELMDEYGLPSVFTSQYNLLRLADVVLTFEDPNDWIRRCKQDAVLLNLSLTPIRIHYGRVVIEGAEAQPLLEWQDRLPADADWSAFCGLFLSELSENLRLKHPIYAKG